MHSLSAAHATLPLPSYVRVTNLNNYARRDEPGRQITRTRQHAGLNRTRQTGTGRPEGRRRRETPFRLCYHRAATFRLRRNRCEPWRSSRAQAPGRDRPGSSLVTLLSMAGIDGNTQLASHSTVRSSFFAHDAKACMRAGSSDRASDQVNEYADPSHTESF